MPIAFAEQSLWVNVTIFVAAAVAVWFGGSRLTTYAQRITDRTSLGRVFAGMVLLGVATSLPEIATTVTAAASGNAALAGNNLLGGVSMQVAVIGFVDLVAFRRGALTFFTPRPVLLMEGVMLVVLLALAVAAMAAGELFSVWGVGVWPVLLAAAYVASLYIIQQYERRPEWVPTDDPTPDEPETEADRFAEPEAGEGGEPRSLARIVSLFAAAALAVFVAGFVVARTGEAIAEQTGLGSSFVGATLVAIATSLPEVSTTFKAVRIGAFGMAISNILGTNAVSVALLLVADMAYRDGPIIDALGRSSIFLAGIGVVITGIYLWGMLERRDRTVWGMGVDSAAVLACYLAGVVVLYLIREG